MMTKRATLKSIAGVALGSFGMPNVVLAQSSPPVRFIIPMTPGGGVDIIGRLVAQEMSRILGVAIVPENKPGASGTIALREVIRATPPTPTFGLALGSTLALVPHMIKVSYDAQNDVKPMTQLGVTPFVLLVHKEHPAKTLGDYVQMSKTQGQSYGSFGSGTSSHVLGETFAMAAGGKLVHVPYRGAASALNDLLGMRIDSVISDFGSSGPHLGSDGKLRGLAVTGSHRSASFPDIATFGEQGYPEMNALVGWISLVAGKNMPEDQVAAWAKAASDAVQTQLVQERMAALGYAPTGASGQAFEMIFADEPARWGALVKAANIKLEG